MDYINAGLLLLGYILIGKNNRYGWIFSILGNIGYVYLLWGTQYKGLLLLSIIMTVICTNNFIKWNKNARNKK